MSKCIEWQGARFKSGYGAKYARKPDGRKTYLRAHRVAYCEANNLDLTDIDGYVVRHKCDNPPCVNPDHLELGTHQDNHNDREARGRTARGERSGKSVLTDELVKQLRAEYIRGNSTCGTYGLAARYGISQATVHRVVTRTAWSHVSDGEPPEPIY